MHVGVFLKQYITLLISLCLPHARGGVSSHTCYTCRNIRVFPMHVVVFRITARIARKKCGLPHARGGVSPTLMESKEKAIVFPMHVGVFLIKRLAHD